MNFSSIYAIINITNDKLYVGSAKNTRLRWNIHRCQLKSGSHDNKFLQSSWNKYGQFNFIFTVIEYISLNNLIKREQYWIDILKATDRNFGYNLRKIAVSNMGYKHSKETRNKVAISRIGKPRSQETKEKLRKANLGKKNGPHSIETKLKMSLAAKGKPKSEIAKLNMRKGKFPKIISVIELND